MRECGDYVYHSKGRPMMDAAGDISLPREEIVRCHDCAWSFHSDQFGGFTRRYCKWFRCDVYNDGFCFWGDRKDDVNDA